MTNWLRLLIHHRFRVSLRKLHKVVIITLVIMILTPLSIIERLVVHPFVRRKDLEYSPVFILGHWRSGTTHLHNMFRMDDRLCYPNMVDAIFPNHMILGNRILRTFLSLTLPDKRPMDDMVMSVDLPGEHDWAISNLCLMSPYSGAYFPNELYSTYRDMTNFENATLLQKQTYIKYIRFYLKKLQFKYPGKQIVLKSPLDTARARLLSEIFPGAKFVHIHRDPCEVFFSTRKLHIRNMDIFPLQEDQRDIDEFVIRTYKDMFDIFLEDQKYLPENNYCEIRFEDLIHQPLATLNGIYQKFDLPEFSSVSIKLKEYLDSTSDYKKEEYEMSQQERDRISQCFSRTISLWGYGTT